MAAGPFGDRSPAEHTVLINALIEFRNAYIPYINATAPAIYAGQPPEHSAERSRILRLAVAASDALDTAGVRFALTPAPVYASSAGPLRGLSQAAFAHEDFRYRSDESLLFESPPPRSYERVIDLVDTAVATLEARRSKAEQRRRRPTYWTDRILRAVLGFPAYLISLVFGFDRRSLSAGTAQTLWVVSLIADLVGVGAAGRAFGWW